MAAPTVRKSVEFFYDVVSPYTWFAFEVLCRYRTRWNMDLKLKPFFLGGIMNESGNKPPAMVPNKGKYMMKTDLHLLAKYFNVPLNMPDNPAEIMFIKGTLASQRFLTSVDMENSSLTEAVSRELWMRGWSRDEDITLPESLKEAGLKAGMTEEQVNKCVGRIKDQNIKDRLKQYTDEALEHGSFGSPTIVAHVESGPVMIFGSDRFPILAQVLGEKWEGPTPGGSKL